MIEEQPKWSVKEGFIGQKMIVLPPNVKESILKNELIKRLYITAIGYYPHAILHGRQRKMGCDQYILLYCVAGQGTVNIDQTTFKLKPNHYTIIPKNVAHQYSTTEKDPWTIYWIHFAGENADLLYQRFAENKLQPVFTAFDERKIRSFEIMLTLLERNFELKNLEITNLKLQDYLSNFIYEDEINPSYVVEDAISNSISYMRTNITKDFSLKDLAKEQHLSVTHYSRLFLAKTGRSPKQYFNELKIQQSCQHLYFSNRSIKEICMEIGFADPFYFSRLFKKVMGIAPASYKNQCKKS